MMSKGKYIFKLFFSALMLLQALGYAQNKAANNHPAIHARIDSLNEQASRLIRKDAVSAYTLLTEAEVLATQYNYNKGKAVTYLNQAEVLSQQGYSKRALELYYYSMQISQRNNDIYNVARAQQHISTIKRKNGGYREAEVLLEHTLDIFTRLNKPIDVINALLRLGLINADQKHYEKAVRFYNQAYLLSRKVNFAHGEKKSYYDRALLYKALNQPDSAIKFLNKALHIDTVTNDAYGKALSYIQLSRIYLNAKDYKKAAFYAKAANRRADSTAALALVKTSVQLLLYISKEAVYKDAIIEWQDQLIEVDNALTEREKKESNNFIDALRTQEEQQIKDQVKILNAEKVSRRQDLLIILYTGFLLVVVIGAFTLYYNYNKAKKYNASLNDKNHQIEQQNQKLEDDNELKNKLLSIITHDLRKPLANTQSIIHLVNMDLVTPEESKELFEQLEAQYTRVMGLTDNLLFWIKGQVSGTSAQLVPVNMHQVVGKIIDEQIIPLNEKSIQVDNNLPADFTWLAQTETLRIIFRNLLSNAVKFTPAGGCVEIYDNNTITETCITVKDSGIGMSAEAMERINLENYYSTKGTENEEGSGFGLMLIRDLVKRQNGKLRINSTPGQGSAFTISFSAATAIKS